MNSFSQKDSSTAYPLKVTLVDLDKDKIYRPVFHALRIKITNTADTAFSFWVMTCSWHGCVSFDPYIVNSDFMGCDQNFPKEIIPKPHDSFSLDGGYKLGDSSFGNPVMLRAGFRVIKPSNELLTAAGDDLFKDTGEKFKRFNSLFENDPKYTKKDYIWSKPTTIRF
ncbi:hypothetical protein GCM10027043_17210 [Ferruginibacter profundus]